ncbi:MAG: hypothetical protein R3318_07430, partial [Gammaproteobacteria bacterium]|nr:hypothetical protein [Gammaproteobacteria bacterium]
MISSLKSRFDRSVRRAIFLSTDKLSVYHWENGKLGNSYLFDVSKDGQAYFDRYLKDSGRVSTYFLIDFIEEEFRQDTIPHVHGADRQAVIERKKARLFRDTPYYYADIQGREGEGRKDDVVMFSALTNPDVLTPWLAILEANKTPLAGIYSLPLVTSTFTDKLCSGVSEALVVSLQSISGLRQTFIKDGKVKVSRLVDMPRYGTEPYSPIIMNEVNNTQRYLNSLQLIDQKKNLNVYFLGDAKLLSEIKKQAEGAPATENHYINLNTFGAELGLNREFTTPFADQIYIYQMLKSRPENNYARKQDRLYYRTQKAGRVMYAASLLLVFAALVYGGVNFMDAAIYRQQAQIASKKTTFYSDRYQLARQRLPETPVAPADLEIAVNISKTLNQFKSKPSGILQTVGTGLQDYPLIVLNELIWASASNPDIKIDGSDNIIPTRGVTGRSNIASEQSEYDYFDIAVIKGEINPFDGNYRNALNMINSFADSLRDLESVQDVSILSLP